MKQNLSRVARFAAGLAVLALSTAGAEEGMGVFYSNYYQGRHSADGGVFDQEGLTAAHKTLKFGTKVKVTNPETKQSVVVTITDRMAANNKNLIDLTRRAAREIGIDKKGRTWVKVELASAETSAETGPEPADANPSSAESGK